MRIIEPHQFKGIIHPKSKKKKSAQASFLLLVFIFGYVSVMLARPLPAITTDIQVKASAKVSEADIKWPAYGQAAIGAVGYGVLGTHGGKEPIPTASMAKVMTALAVLKVRPLKTAEQGPTITLTQTDYEDYLNTLAVGGSNVAVAPGEEITEYEALQAMLLPSANNMANSLVRWAFGSEKAYLQFVNNFANSLGMENTTIADASGFSSETVSTAEDLTKLAVNAMDNPVLAEIAGQKSATVPVAGTIYNVNNLLGSDNIIGLKTGNTIEAGGCFMAAAETEVNGQKIIAVSVIMRAPDRATALRDSVPLVNSVLNSFEKRTVITAGQKVAEANVPWQGKIALTAKNEISGTAWKQSDMQPSVKPKGLLPNTPADSNAGQLSVRFGRENYNSDIKLTQPIKSPPLTWRIMPVF